MHQVEPATGQAGVPRITFDHLDVGKPAACGVLRGHRDVGWAGIHADDPSARRNGGRQQAEDSARAAAEIGRGLPRPQAGPGEQRLGFGSQFCGLAPQPGALLLTGAERVHLSWIRAGTGARGYRIPRGTGARGHASDRGHDRRLLVAGAHPR